MILLTRIDPEGSRARRKNRLRRRLYNNKVKFAKNLISHITNPFIQTFFFP